ncbi:MAG TPA: SMP-30/gluconolactonase/LRE family protein [Acidimicrobiales bacterium]|nr:SMP-30/gluconolactonase/LRE family protein [Acidimicrobiales bacterium]
MDGFETLATGYELVEAPTWLPDGGLAFSDVLGGGVYRLDPDGSVSTLVPKRRGVGGIAVHADGGIVCSGRDLIRVVDGETTPVFGAGGANWNDLAVDADGAVWAGSVRFAVFDPDAAVVPGELWRIDAAGGEPVVEGIHHCNGVGFSPDGSRVYVSDTRRNVVVASDLDGGNRRELAVPFPDGLAVDVDGFVWMASFTGGNLVRIDADGAVERTLEVGPPVTSVCLGQDGDLIVVTASGRGESGSILRTRVDVAGVPIHPARV